VKGVIAFVADGRSRMASIEPYDTHDECTLNSLTVTYIGI
jgi:hypothetical protein